MKLEQVELQPSLRTKLVNEGYETVEELKKANIIDLSKDLKLSKDELNRLFELTRGKAPVRGGKNMMEIVLEDSDKGILLPSNNLNSLFENGIPVRRLTEICGESGSGKTQICMQLAVNVQLPKEKGGLEGECIYIDTEGSFLSHRLIKMINEDTLPFLNRIHVFRVFNHAELIALIRQLPDILSTSHKDKVKLIVIDSIAYHFRLNTLTSQRRNLLLPFLAQSLIRIATNHNLAVVVTNHVTEHGQNGPWIPTLPAEWGAWCAFRLFLFRKRQFRFGYLYKNIEDQDIKPVQFCIKANGITDPDRTETIQNDQELDSEEIIEKLENSWGELKIEKSIDIWSQNLLVDEEEKNIPLIDLPPSEPDLTSSSEPQKTNTMNTTNNMSNRHTQRNTSESTLVMNSNKIMIQNGSSSTSSPKTIDNRNYSSHHDLKETEKNTVFENKVSPQQQTEKEEEAPLPEKSSGTHIENKKRPSRNKGKRKQIDEDVHENDIEQIINNASSNGIFEKSETIVEPQQQQTNNGNKRRKRNTKQKETPQPLEQVEVPEYSEPLPLVPLRGRKGKEVSSPPKRKNGRKKVQNEDLSDWSDSEMEDDFEFIYHFDEPF